MTMHGRRGAVIVWVVLLILLLGGASAAAQDGDEGAPSVGDTVVLTLTNDDVVRGIVVRNRRGSLTLDHALMGKVRVATEAMSSVEIVSRAAGSDDQGEGDAEQNGSDVGEPEDEDVSEVLAEAPGVWAVEIDAGLSGSSGNSSRANARLRFGATYASAHNTFDFYSLYLYSEEDGTETQNRTEVGVHNDFLFPGSPWLIFVRGLFEYDREASYDYRGSGTLGVGYAFIQTDDLALIGRVGFGASKEWGSANTDVLPEGFASFELKHRLDQRQSIFTNAEFFPNLDDLREFRVRLQSGYEVQIDASGNLYLKIGIEDRYNEIVDPGDDRNDLDYFVTLSYQF